MDEITDIQTNYIGPILSYPGNKNPICRLWLKNRPYNRESTSGEKSPSPERESHSEDEVTDIQTNYIGPILSYPGNKNKSR
jgi:hypothetical protein